MTFNIRLFLLPGMIVINACNNHSSNQDKPLIDPIKAAPPSKSLTGHPYPTFNAFLDSIRIRPLPSTPADLGATDSFSFSGFHFIFTSTPAERESAADCDSLFTYHFTINDRIARERAIPDSLRNHGFKLDKFCSLKLQPKDATKFVLGGTTYLQIPSSFDECIGGFCHTELDHLFAIAGDSIIYLTVDGWQTGDINHDGFLDQVIINDDPLRQYVYLKKIKNDSLDARKCANIQVWSFKDGHWIPLLDEKGNPYFIFLSFEHGYDRDTYQVLDYNWPFSS